MSNDFEIAYRAQLNKLAGLNIKALLFVLGGETK